jgi:hypothetical protein
VTRGFWRAAFAVLALLVWWVLVWAFGNLLYTAVLGWLEKHFQLQDAKVVAGIAEYAAPLAAIGILVGLMWLIMVRAWREPPQPDPAALAANTQELRLQRLANEENARLQRAQEDARLRAEQESIAIQDQLGAFAYRAHRLLSLCRDQEGPSPAGDYRGWAEETSAYLTLKLGPAYAARFDYPEQPAATPIPPAFLADPVRRTVWIRLTLQTERLEAFIRETA